MLVCFFFHKRHEKYKKRMKNSFYSRKIYNSLSTIAKNCAILRHVPKKAKLSLSEEQIWLRCVPQGAVARREMVGKI